MRKPRRTPKLAAVSLLMVMCFPDGAKAQVTAADYDSLLGAARNYASEGRMPEALAALKKAQAARPSDQILAEIGALYLGLGMLTEAESVGIQLLSKGGTVSLPMREHSLFGYRWGTLFITRDRIRWESTKAKENFEVPLTEIQDLRLVPPSPVPDRNRGHSFNFRVGKKTWLFEVLYGEEKTYGGKTVRGIPIYSGFSPLKQEAARNMLVGLIQKASSNSLLVEPKKNEIVISVGMTKDEVIKALGEPLKTIVFGKKTILKYAEITVELEDNKVVEVKAN